MTDDALKYALDYYGFDRRAIDFDSPLAAYESLALFDDAAPTLERLQATRYRLAVLSNGNPDMLEIVLENAGLSDWLVAVVSADEVSTFKPSPAVYQRSAERLDVPLGK